MKKGLLFIITIIIFILLVTFITPKQEELPQNNQTFGSATFNLDSGSGNIKIDSFSQAKNLLETEVYNDTILSRIDQYCGCSYTSKKNVNLESCGFTTSGKQTSRSQKVEWEHVVPAENFGQSFIEWREGHSECIDSQGRLFKGRNCAEKVNMSYRYMQADMYNLIPVIGEVNALRSNYQYTQLNKEDIKYTFGKCDSKVGSKLFEPRDQVKGLVARISLYMGQTYPSQNIISDKQRKLYEAWDRLYPVTKDECIRYKTIKEIQGNENEILKTRCKEGQSN